MIAKLLELVLPRLTTSVTPEELARRQQEDIDRIKATDWSKHPDVAIEEARRLADAELGRRQNADGKATTYLAATAALIPIALTLQAAIWDSKAGKAPVWLNVSILAIAVLYTMCAGIWAFRTLQVAGSHRVDLGDLSAAWANADPRPDLIKKTLSATRMNWNGNNRKVSCIMMTHAYLLRAFVMLAFLLMLNAAWIIGDQAWSRIRDMPMIKNAPTVVKKTHPRPTQPVPAPPRRSTPVDATPPD